jgi:hypothetical protein
MKRSMKRWVAVAGAAAIFGLSSVANAQDAAVLKDLTAVLALNGQACGEVVSAVRQGDSDYLASCKDGNNYRVFTNGQGRVIVEKK